MGQQSSYRPPNPPHQYSQQSRPLPASVPLPSRSPAHAAQPQNNSWKFTNSFGPQKPLLDGNKSTNQPRTAQQTQTVVGNLWKIYRNTQRFKFLSWICSICICPKQMKPVAEHSLRILTAVIDGMRHWSQFKDKVPYLCEIFGELIKSCDCCNVFLVFLNIITDWLCSSFSFSWLCCHSGTSRSKELPHERWEGGGAVCLLWKCEAPLKK